MQVEHHNETHNNNNNNTANSKRSLRIKVKSSKSHVQVSVDDIVVHDSKSSLGSSKNDDNEDQSEGRGIHVIVLNEFSGQLMASRIFDTYAPNQDQELCLFLNMLSDNRILILAVQDEGSFKMPPNSPARHLLSKLGSRHIMKLAWRDMWAIVVRKSTLLETNSRLGQQSTSQLQPIDEALSKSSKFSDWGPPVVLDTFVDLLDASSVRECSWNSGNSAEDARRRHFCGQLEGYGRVCDCNFPAQISFQPKKFSEIQNWQLSKVPIVVIASNRPYYLFRMLRSLLSVDGVDKSMISVFIDGFYEEPSMVCRLFDVRVQQQKPEGKRSARISHHYKSSLSAIFELHPEAQEAIIFEEDLDVSRDALIYFNQTLEVLRADESLYCVSAWNDQGYEHSARDAALLYRIETMPGLGWMLTRKLYKEELERSWPSSQEAHDWDMWIRTEQVRKSRECIIPDLSRTFHFGAFGTNINSYFQRQYFSKHAFNLAPQSDFSQQIKHLQRDNYESHLAELLRDAQVIRNQQKLCDLAKLDSDKLLASSLNSIRQDQTKAANISQVIFIEMIDQHDFSNWLWLAKCWRIWDLDARGQHNSMWRLFLNAKPTLVVGVPASPYARFKPPDLKPFKLAASSETR